MRRRSFLAGVALATMAAGAHGGAFRLLYAPPSGLLAPNAQWSGSAGSGYGGSNAAAPTNPTRTTAMPWILPLFVPGVRATGQMDIWFEAGALGGLTKVTVYCEGNKVDVAAPTTCTYTDANGLPKVLPSAYKVTLDIATALGLSTTGCMQIYAEAVPVDGSMQHHVIGPFDVFPASSLYDHAAFDVGSGQTYATIQAALNAAHTAASIWPKIVLHDTANYDCTASVTVTHNCTAPTPGVAGTGGLATITTTGGATATLIATGVTTAARLKYDGLHFLGSGIVLDPGQFQQFYVETAGIGKLWFDGCQVVNSFGSAQLVNKAVPALYWLRTPATAQTTNYYATEVSLSGMFDGLQYHNLVRTCSLTNISSDALDNNRCIYGTTVTTLDPTALTGGQVGNGTALTVLYSGASATATFQKTGTNSNAGNIILVDTVNGTSTFAYTATFSNGQTNYTVQDVANFINGIAGWSATVSDNSRYAAALSNTPTVHSSAIAAISCKTSQNFTTLFDVHSDGCQNFSISGYNEPGYADSVLGNRAFAYNSWLNVIDSQLFYGDKSGSGGATSTQWADCGIHNNVWQEIGATTSQTQVFGTQSHVVFQANTLDNQTFSLRSDQASPSTYAPDAYCAFIRCAFENLLWSGTPNANLKIQSLFVRTSSLPSGADGNSKTGASAAASTIYTNPAYPGASYVPLSAGGTLQLGDATYAGRYLPTGAENISP